MSKKNPLRQIGITTDGRPVIGGCFKMHDTFGFSLADSLWFCKHNGCVVGVEDFMKKAHEAGWPAKKIVAKVFEAHREAAIPIVPEFARVVEWYGARLESATGA